MGMRIKMLLATASISVCGMVHADVTVQMHAVDEKGIGQSVGQVVVSESAYGLVFTPALSSLSPGVHGFHVHEKGDCSSGDGMSEL